MKLKPEKPVLHTQLFFRLKFHSCLSCVHKVDGMIVHVSSLLYFKHLKAQLNIVSIHYDVYDMYYGIRRKGKGGEISGAIDLEIFIKLRWEEYQ